MYLAAWGILVLSHLVACQQGTQLYKTCFKYHVRAHGWPALSSPLSTMLEYYGRFGVRLPIRTKQWYERPAMRGQTSANATQQYIHKFNSPAHATDRYICQIQKHPPPLRLLLSSIVPARSALSRGLHVFSSRCHGRVRIYLQGLPCVALAVLHKPVTGMHDLVQWLGYHQY